MYKTYSLYISRIWRILWS